MTAFLKQPFMLQTPLKLQPSGGHLAQRPPCDSRENQETMPPDAQTLKITASLLLFSSIQVALLTFTT
jgi:hypothetical protein